MTTEFWQRRPDDGGTRLRRALKRTARQAWVVGGTCVLFAVVLALVR